MLVRSRDRAQVFCVSCNLPVRLEQAAAAEESTPPARTSLQTPVQEEARTTQAPQQQEPMEGPAQRRSVDEAPAALEGSTRAQPAAAPAGSANEEETILNQAVCAILEQMQRATAELRAPGLSTERRREGLAILREAGLALSAVKACAA